MHQREIDQAVANVTLEPLEVVRRHGFQLEQKDPADTDPSINWDQLQLERNVQLVRHSRPATA